MWPQQYKLWTVHTWIWSHDMISGYDHKILYQNLDMFNRYDTTSEYAHKIWYHHLHMITWYDTWIWSHDTIPGYAHKIWYHLLQTRKDAHRVTCSLWRGTSWTPDGHAPPADYYSREGPELQWSDRHLRRRGAAEQDYPTKKTCYRIRYLEI